MSSVLQPFRAFARVLRRNPGFVLIAVLTLGAGIGANAAIFSVVNAVLIRPLPYPEPERIVAVWHTAPGLGMDRINQSDATYLLYRKHNRVLEDLGIYYRGSVALTGGQEPERVGSSGVTGSVFQVLQVPPLLGRWIQEADEKPGAEPVVVLSYELWKRRFGGDRGAVGSTLQVDGVARRVVGVMPAGFHFPSADAELWIPLPIDPANLAEGNFNYDGVGRLRLGVSNEQATREISALVWRIPEEFGGEDFTRGMIENAKLSTLIYPLRNDVVGEVERILWILLGSVGLILLIACANVANLFLVRAESRQREVAVRTALGASRWNIARVFLSESLVLSLLGGALGIALAAGGVKVLRTLEPQGIPRLEEIGVDGTVLAFTVLLALLAGFLVGGFAALRYGAPDLVPALKEGGRGGMAGRARHRARNVLVALQMALALVLLVGAGLMVKSFWQLKNVDPGLKPESVLTVRLDLPEAKYRDVPSTARFVQQLLERVRAIQGVESAGTISLLPLSGGRSSSGHAIEDHPLPPDTVPPMLGTRFASPGYFEAMGIPLIEGQVFDRLDPDRRTDGVVVSQAVAERFWQGKSALGRRLSSDFSDSPTWFTIVGVVGSVREQSLDEKPTEAVYYPVSRLLMEDEGEGEEWVPRNFTLVVRGRVAPTSLVAPVREAVWALDPNLPLAQVYPMAEVVERSMVRTSFTMLLLVIAATVALLLGSVGIYGVISYVVSQRTQEIGVRMALGARRQDISRMVLREGLLLTVIGIALGLAGSFWITRFMVALLHDVSPNDPVTFAAVPVLLALVALVASYLPARKAALVEPLEAIRYE
ncbi:MAG TPA: ABC transporter permease [Thermoanaerobaculia bacterium]